MSDDPLLLDAEQLTQIASDAVVRRGVAYFREHRVTEISWNETSMRAVVQGSRMHEPYDVIVTLDEGELAPSCSCPFDGEPVCKHTIAALLAYGARQPVSESQAKNATDAAVEERATRARGEVQVRHVSGDAWFGGWEAWSLDPRLGEGRRYRVDIRSTGERINHCMCPDFATNRLGTCKHVEAVLHRLRRRGPKRFEELARTGPPVPVVHLHWEGDLAPGIRLSGPRSPELARHFGNDGRLRGALPQAWSAARSAVAAVGVVGPDVDDHARRLGEASAAQLRGETIRQEILRAGSHLPGVNARLYPYQVDGVAFLVSTQRALLADDMGLGKTLQAIAACAWMLNRGEVQRCLIVCPASLKHQWQRELRKFTGREAVVVAGGAAQRGALYRQGAAFTIVNYELLMRDLDVVQRTLAPDVLVLDEAQRIKNWRTRIATCVKSLQTSHAFVLSGTPLENRLEDLYSLMQVVDPRVLGPLWRFLLDFHVMDAKGKVLGYRNLGELRRRLASVMLRRDRSLVRDQLPDRIETRRDLALDPRQRALHDDAVERAGRLALISQRRPLTPEEEELLMRFLQTARMACDAAGLVDKETKGSPKLEELGRILEELCIDGGRKVVVFSQWERMTAMAQDVARELGLGSVRLHGGVPSNKRGDLIDKFMEDPSIQVFFSTDAGGVGLNLQAATALVNLDVPWNPAVVDQRVARVHRLGQKEPVQVIHLVAENAYETRVLELVGGKRMLFNNVVKDDATEDVVGVSRKGIEAALETLQGQKRPDASGGGDPEEGQEQPPVAEAALVAPEPEPEPESVPVLPPEPELAPEPLGPTVMKDPTTDAEDERVHRTIAEIDLTFGARVERILGAQGGLIVVLRVMFPGDSERAANLGDGLPVAAIDAGTAAALARMGGTPISTGTVLREATEPAKVADVATRKLDAAETLLSVGQVDEALPLVVGALLVAAARAGGTPVVTSEQAPVWLYATAVPKGWLTGEDAALVLRACALNGAADVPAELAGTLLREARALVARTAP